MSCGISGGKQKVNFANARNRGRLRLFSQNETRIWSCKMYGEAWSYTRQKPYSPTDFAAYILDVIFPRKVLI